MAASYAFKFDGREIAFRKSVSQVAVAAMPGQGRAFESVLSTMAQRAPGVGRQRLGRFEVIDVLGDSSGTLRERVRLSHSPAVREAAAVYHTSADGVPFVPEGTITLRMAEDGVGALTDLTERYRLTNVAVTPDGAYVLGVPRGAGDAVETAARLMSEPGVALSQPDMITPVRLLNVLPDDALLARQWHLENLGHHNGTDLNYTAGADARVLAAWRRLGHLGRAEVVVGIIDDGFDLGHPDLADKAVAPWDFIRGSADVAPEPDLDQQGAGDWHGTACAGVAVGRAGGGDTVGAAPNASLMPVRMWRSLSPHEVARWFDHMRENGAWVVSCSWNAQAAVYSLPDPIAHAITRCAREGRGGKGCVVVFAAGNEAVDIDASPTSQNGFATHPEVLAVSACTSRDRRSDYSCFGSAISVAAPSSGGISGWPITTIDVRGDYVDASGATLPRGYVPGPYTHGFGGTSSACPLVAGVCALVLSANPGLTAAEVRDVIRGTARKPAGHDFPGGHSVQLGHGVVNADAAVARALELRGERMLIAGADSDTTTT